jgi:PIN domain nuclease of toxin-antitoxin system
MIVADTHVIVWNALRSDKLSKKAKKAISVANEGDGIIFCEISLWEIAMLIKKGRLSVDVGYQEFVGLVSESNKYVFQGITPAIAELSADFLSRGNKDPADAIIAATSIVQKAELVTADKVLRQSKSIATIW